MKLKLLSKDTSSRQDNKLTSQIKLHGLSNIGIEFE